MSNFTSVNKLFEKSFKEHWDLPAVSNYKGIDLCYKDVARIIAELHIVYENSGVVKGDRIAICSKNQANWAVAFLSALTYGAVPVPILHEFKAGNIHHLVNHSESKVLFVDEQIWENINEAEMPDLLAIVNVTTLDLLVVRDENITAMKENIGALMAGKYPNGFGPDDLNYYEDSAEELAVINYTSGTSGFSKGVMLPYRSLWSNMDFAHTVLPEICSTSKLLSILPSAHMYGLMFELLYHLTQGVHVYFLNRVPSPKVIMMALADVKPNLVIAVPLIIEKVYKSKLKPELDKAGIKTLRKWVPGFELILLNKMRSALIEAFGGNFIEVIIGGAAFNKEVEAFFHKMKFPFTVGYGMTECGPIISYAPWDKAKVGSSGYAANNMEIRIDSADPQNIPGEIQVRGANVFLGYFKNEEATAEVFTEDGWFRTGDMGVLDNEGFLFIKGRNKCMILGPSGQNIYPEELETVLNNLPYVNDTLVVEDNGSLSAIIYPDFQSAEKDGMNKDQLQKYLDECVAQANENFPNYSKIKSVEILPEDFERTPKKSIKRYLYQR